MVPFWVAELARTYWELARMQEPFPRNLRRSIARAVPLSLMFVPKLSIRAALERLANSGFVCKMPGKDRPLRACLVARSGHGIALIDGSDGDDEQRFSIAHELAHFLRDYSTLRARVVRRLGEPALQVLDGERPATEQERLQALLGNVPLGCHFHLRERDQDGRPLTPPIARAEDDADRLAYELLAPAEHILANAPSSRQSLVRRLRECYGLPEIQASRYAAMLVPPARTDPLILRLRGHV